MLKKIEYLLWISVLVVFGFLIGAYFSLGNSGFTNYDYEMKFVTGGIAMLIVLGAIIILIYKFLKKRDHGKPLFPALTTASIVLFFFGVITAFWYNDILDKHQQQLFMERFEEDLTQHFSEQLRIDADDTFDTAISLAVITIWYDLERTKMDLNGLYSSKDPMTFISEDIALKQIFNQALMTVMEDEDNPSLSTLLIP